MRILTHGLPVLVIAVFATALQAQECKNGKCQLSTTATSTQEKCKGSTCPLQTTATSAQDEKCKDGQCPIEAAMTKLPKMTFKVGDKATCCPKSAAALAKASDSPIVYVVGKNEFKQKEKAYTSLVESTEKFVKTFATPCKCEVSNTTTIAGKTCSCPVEAGERAKLVATAMKDVQMSYKVGDKTCNCPNMAASLETSSGKKKQFVVGETCTDCEMTARINLAHAKYKAAVTAIAKAEKKAAGTEKK